MVPEASYFEHIAFSDASSIKDAAVSEPSHNLLFLKYVALE